MILKVSSTVRPTVRPSVMAAWRVVYMVGEPVDCDNREHARELAAKTAGKVQGYIPAVGWLDDSRIPE